MSILIDGAELKEWVENWFYQHKYYHPYSKSNDIPCNELYDILERMPTIDAVEVVHGEWIEDINLVKCSVCREKHYFGERWNYCPNCGAKMDGERRDPCSSQDS